ncbi:helix-turn-helix domain-containing protein [uncultured Brevundimonas sp.]|uniref:winged helix-turn-helix transcriptional regulator n=1 Tax=uncultured Brevundimonas sp. TaxID=213418 RepID=UPI0030EF79FE|tara:strand:- start:3560 stop:3928 length:369 start_codon:yes stop_codon:yes gene_type:complete
MSLDSLDFPRSGCPIANTLEVVGDRWSLVIVRDLLNGKRHYGDFLTSPEGITTSVLAQRLVRLEAAGLVERRPYRSRPVRYDYILTAKGAALRPVLQAMCAWANIFIPGTWPAPDDFMRPGA